VTTENVNSINWSDVAARAKADLGDDRIAPTSERVRNAMLLIAADRPYRSEGFRCGVRPLLDEVPENDR
jgi:hypothetical protein